jgi:hypothetical protein
MKSTGQACDFAIPVSIRSAVTDNLQTRLYAVASRPQQKGFITRGSTKQLTIAREYRLGSSGRLTSLTRSYNSRNDSFGATCWVFLDLMLPDPNHVPSHSA